MILSLRRLIADSFAHLLTSATQVSELTVSSSNAATLATSQSNLAQSDDILDDVSV
jgi:hypothetical protein